MRSALTASSGEGRHSSRQIAGFEVTGVRSSFSPTYGVSVLQTLPPPERVRTFKDSELSIVSVKLSAITPAYVQVPEILRT